MNKLENVKPFQVLKYFEDICKIPHGSGDMDKISSYCVDFAKKNSLKFVCDEAKNVIIYKDGSKGFEECEPIILQAHLDMVCQSSSDLKFDFENDPIDIIVDREFIKANGTTLGADNGIGVAIIMAILADKELPHPPIEAVFTTDEEIGMIGASKLDFSLFKSKRMINLDSEEEDILTVSCAGGSDFTLSLPAKKEMVTGEKVLLTIDGLKGGHSGVEIDKGRINANLLGGRILNHLRNRFEFSIIDINGGTKANAIPFSFTATLVTDNAKALINEANIYFKKVKEEIISREPDCCLELKRQGQGDFEAFDVAVSNTVTDILLTCPNGIIEMSAEIQGLVETSLNLGVLKFFDDHIFFHFALRSNKASALDFLEGRLTRFAKLCGCDFNIFGRYEPWEFQKDSPLQRLYADAFNDVFNKEAKIQAIHAGLECAVFSAKIKDLDCISIGPDIFDVHSPKEKVSISSVERIYNLLKKIFINSLQK